MKLRISALVMSILLVCSGMTVSAAPKTMPDGGVFDPQFYAALYPDVVAVFGTSESLLYQHYVTYGKAEGRLPYDPAAAAAAASAAASAPAGVKTMSDGGLFDPLFYYNTYPEVAAAFGYNEALLYKHYLNYGRAEGRLPYTAAGVTAPAAQTPPAQTPAAQTPAALPGYGPGTSSLQLDAGSLLACYRLTRTDGSEQFRVFLAPGTSVTKSFPSGQYVLKTAEGTAWISDTQAFGQSGIYGKSDLYYFEPDAVYIIQSSTTHGDFNSTNLNGFLN